MKVSYDSEIKPAMSGQIRTNDKGIIILVGARVTNGVPDIPETSPGYTFLHVPQREVYNQRYSGMWRSGTLGCITTSYPYVLDATLNIENMLGGELK